MRSAPLCLAPALVHALALAPALALGLSGCAGWVVFGHTIGEDRPAAAQIPRTQPPAASAPPGQAAPAVSAAPTQPLVASQVQAAPAAQSAQPAAMAQPAVMQTAGPAWVGSVYIIVSPQAKDQIAKDTRFDAQKLLAAVENELQARRLLVAADATIGSGASANRRMEIDVDAFSTRASSNAVIFGYALGSGELAADIRLRDAEGRQISGFPVQAKARLATRPAEQDPNPLGNLYHRFAVLTADRLAGVTSKPDEAEVMPR
jgi:hypothetical protein